MSLFTDLINLIKDHWFYTTVFVGWAVLFYIGLDLMSTITDPAQLKLLNK